MGALPSLFVSHGAPTLVIDKVPAHAFLRGLGSRLPAPDAVLCVSAHWERRRPALTAAGYPPTIHDFFGFPDELYRMTYPCPGSPSLASRARDLLAAAGIEADLDAARGLDHGAWVPLKLMYPDAAIPVIQLSVQPHQGPAHQAALGRALAPLRNDGVLILASGGATHDLRAFGRYAIDADSAAYAAEFDEWLRRSIEGGEEAELLDYARSAPHGLRNHPTPEHFLPVFTALGAGGPGTRGSAARGARIHSSFTYGVFSMAAFAWGAEGALT